MVATTVSRHFTAEDRARMREIGVAPDEGHRFTVDEYDRIIAAGILAEGERVELIRGEVVTMSAMGGRHMRCVLRLDRLLHDLVPRDLFVSPQCPVRLPDSEPEPDLAVIRDWDFAQSVPDASLVLLVMEVADATLKDDREVKLPLYAAAGIPEAWLVDLKAGIIERHIAPQNGHYTQTATGKSGDTLSSTTVPSLVIPVADVLR